VLANDSDVDGDTLTAALDAGPAHGTLALAADGSFAYTPAAGFTGADSFAYRAGDGAATSAPATVSIDVRPAAPPLAAKVQQPVNADGSSVFKANRGVVPVKFTLTSGGAATCQLPAATITVTRASGQGAGTVDESVFSSAADAGSSFRVSDCQYVYNLAASSLGVGSYRVGIVIGGAEVGSATFALK